MYHASVIVVLSLVVRPRTIKNRPARVRVANAAHHIRNLPRVSSGQAFEVNNETAISEPHLVNSLEGGIERKLKTKSPLLFWLSNQ